MRRPSYHHGDLANALTTAATELAREGGPEAVVLREAARQVGVSATAAYRHFAGHGDLMHAVKERCAARLGASMNAELGRTPVDPDPRAEVLRKLAAFGRGYLQFALTEPGLFRTAFCRPATTSHVHTFPPGSSIPEPETALATPYEMLVQTIDDLVTVGLLKPEHRPWAEVYAWSAVHGLALLLLDGPLAFCSREEQEQMIARVLDGVRAGLAAG